MRARVSRSGSTGALATAGAGAAGGPGAGTTALRLGVSAGPAGFNRGELGGLPFATGVVVCDASFLLENSFFANDFTEAGMLEGVGGVGNR